MPDVDPRRAAVEGYVAAYNADDPDALIPLFAPDAVLLDPVGTDAHVGHAAIRTFWDSVHQLSPHIGLTPRQITVCGGEAAMVMDIEAAGMVLQAVDVFEFDADGLITSLKAYWDMEQGQAT